jgi:hypothetical protein
MQTLKTIGDTNEDGIMKHLYFYLRGDESALLRPFSVGLFLFLFFCGSIYFFFYFLRPFFPTFCISSFDDIHHGRLSNFCAVPGPYQQCRDGNSTSFTFADLLYMMCFYVFSVGPILFLTFFYFPSVYFSYYFSSIF